MRKQFQQTVRQIGWVNCGWYALSRFLALSTAGRVTLFRYYITAQPVTTIPFSKGRGAAIDVREVMEGELDASQFDRPAAIIAERFRRGARCLAAYKGNNLLGYLWFTLGDYQEDEVRALFSPDNSAAWDFDVQIFPQYQLTMAFPRLWDSANVLLHSLGVRWSCSRISAFNAASGAAHRRMGAKPISTAVFLVCGNWQLTLATQMPFVQLSGSASSAPVFRLVPGSAGLGSVATERAAGN
jgi:hypothetical protein